MSSFSVVLFPPMLFGELVGMTVFFIADTHFNHRKIIDYCARPFDSVKEMNQGIIERWNSIVYDYDTVFHAMVLLLKDKANRMKE